MRKLSFNKKLFLSAAGLAAFAVPFALGFLNSMPTLAQSQAHNAAATAPPPAFQYEVASFKPDKSDGSKAGMTIADDGFTSFNFSLQALVQDAYGVQSYQVFGAPDWLTSEPYDVEAKMDGPTADALQKLSQENRDLARQLMLQALLADRLKLTIHRETRELPVYFLVVAKNGPKLQQAKTDETYANGFKDSDGLPLGAGFTRTVQGRLSATMTTQGIPLSALAQNLWRTLRRPVLDKTGLAGKYDFTLTWAPDDTQADSNAPSLFTALQQQLGLKLESGKGPLEVIVIDHVERPSGN
ncbi:MAG: TIGR03435 family protein [Candidatus Acidiferrales bacterium]